MHGSSQGCFIAWTVGTYLHCTLEAEPCCLYDAGGRGRVQKQTFAYMLGPVVQSAQIGYQEFRLSAQVGLGVASA